MSFKWLTKLRLAIWVAAAVMLTLVGAQAGYTQLRPTTVQRKPIEQPNHWVAFEADVQVLQGADSGDLRGRFYRNSDGSTRLEEEQVNDRENRTVSIHNIALAKWFTFNPLKGWTSRPMVLPPNGWQPALQYQGNPQFRPSTIQRDGRPLYEKTFGSDEIWVEDPALNFFPVIKQELLTGRHETYTKIVEIEPPAELFEPPVGADVVELRQPGGIVWAATAPPEHPMSTQVHAH
jgi:hypothetical protein